MLFAPWQATRLSSHFTKRKQFMTRWQQHTGSTCLSDCYGRGPSPIELVGPRFIEGPTLAVARPLAHLAQRGDPCCRRLEHTIPQMASVWLGSAERNISY